MDYLRILSAHQGLLQRSNVKERSAVCLLLQQSQGSNTILTAEVTNATTGNCNSHVVQLLLLEQLRHHLLLSFQRLHVIERHYRPWEISYPNPPPPMDDNLCHNTCRNTFFKEAIKILNFSDAKCSQQQTRMLELQYFTLRRIR